MKRTWVVFCYTTAQSPEPLVYLSFPTFSHACQQAALVAEEFGSYLADLALTVVEVAP